MAWNRRDRKNSKLWSGYVFNRESKNRIKTDSVSEDMLIFARLTDSGARGHRYSSEEKSHIAKVVLRYWWTYFVIAPDVDLVKIGQSRDLWKRINALKGGSPTPLILWTAFRHSETIEKKLHRYLAEHRRHGEWFEPCDKVLEVISLAESGGGPAVSKLLYSWEDSEDEALDFLFLQEYKSKS